MGTTAMNMDIVTEASGHNVVPMAPNMCITPAAPSPLPMPYPITATSASLDPGTEALVDTELMDGQLAQRKDLDLYADPDGHRTLDRFGADFQDSGAIMVGAASSTVPHIRRPSSNFGSRIDCYAWGENVDTLSTDRDGEATDLYTTSFNETSGASAIISGAAVITQSAALEMMAEAPEVSLNEVV